MVARRKQPLTRTGIVVVVALIAAAAIAMWALTRPNDAAYSRSGMTGEESPAAVDQGEPEAPATGPAAPAPSKRARKKPAEGPSGGRIVGRVIDRDSGEALRGAVATATVAGEGVGAKRRSKEGEAPGHFTIEPVPPGTYDLKVRAPSYLPEKLEDVPLKAGLANVGDIELTRGSYVEGTVVDAGSGAPVARAVVRAELGADDAGPSPRTTTDDRGAFLLGPLAAGAAPVRISRVGYDTLRLPAVQLPRGGVATLDSLKLHAREGASPDTLGPASPGLALKHLPGKILVRQVVPGSPADEASVTAGLEVVSIAGYPAEDLSPDEAIRLLHGPPKTVVSLEARASEAAHVKTYQFGRQ